MNVCRYSALFFAAIAAAVSLAVASAHAGEVLFEDDFESLDPAWGEATDAVKVQDKKLVVQPPVGMSQTQLNQGFIFEDAELAGKVRLAQGDDPNQYAGLVFWAEDYDNYYALTVTTDGRYGVIRRVKGRWLYPVSFRAHAAVKKGADQWNALRVVAKGSTATVFINDQQAISFKGQAPRGGGMIGVHGESGKTSPAICEFSHITVSR